MSIAVHYPAPRAGGFPSGSARMPTSVTVVEESMEGIGGPPEGNRLSITRASPRACPEPCEARRSTPPSPTSRRCARRTWWPATSYATATNRCWVADLTHVVAWAGTVYVAFVVDTFSRRIAGWSTALTKQTELVLSALEMAIWQRYRAGSPIQPGELVHHSDSEYLKYRMSRAS
ncbi:DDE-type integrase/transposase/recombinase [Streptomyces sp. NPDC001093]|uniref:DDE-type integrase/transposase/recombinase n=1 Tax=Streptomyces sp. NPDC001093 TaxID=3154376 RepID=UPI00332A9C3C